MRNIFNKKIVIAIALLLGIIIFSTLLILNANRKKIDVEDDRVITEPAPIMTDILEETSNGFEKPISSPIAVHCANPSNITLYKKDSEYILGYNSKYITTDFTNSNKIEFTEKELSKIGELNQIKACENWHINSWKIDHKYNKGYLSVAYYTNEDFALETFFETLYQQIFEVDLDSMNTVLLFSKNATTPHFKELKYGILIERIVDEYLILKVFECMNCGPEAAEYVVFNTENGKWVYLGTHLSWCTNETSVNPSLVEFDKENQKVSYRKYVANGVNNEDDCEISMCGCEKYEPIGERLEFKLP